MWPGRKYLLESTHENWLGLILEGREVFGTNQSRSLLRWRHVVAKGLLDWWVSAASGECWGLVFLPCWAPLLHITANKESSDRQCRRSRKEINSDISAPSPNLFRVVLFCSKPRSKPKSSCSLFLPFCLPSPRSSPPLRQTVKEELFMSGSLHMLQCGSMHYFILHSSLAAYPLPHRCLFFYVLPNSRQVLIARNERTAWF